MGAIIEEILGKMAKFPEARVQHDVSSITYFPDSSNGFAVRLSGLERPVADGELFRLLQRLA